MAACRCRRARLTCPASQKTRTSRRMGAFQLGANGPEGGSRRTQKHPTGKNVLMNHYLWEEITTWDRNCCRVMATEIEGMERTADVENVRFCVLEILKLEIERGTNIANRVQQNKKRRTKTETRGRHYLAVERRNARGKGRTIAAKWKDPDVDAGRRNPLDKHVQC